MILFIIIFTCLILAHLLTILVGVMVRLAACTGIL